MGKWSMLRNSTYKRTVKSILLIKKIEGLVEMTFGLINVSLSLPKWQAVKMTFFASWEIKFKPRINLNHNIIHVTLLKLLLHIQYPQLLPISLTILETKLQTSLEFVFFVLHTNGDIHCRQYLSQDSILGKMYCKQSGSGKVQRDWEKSGENIYKE